MRKFSVSHFIFFVSLSIGAGSFFVANVTVKQMSTSAWIAVAAGIFACALPIFIICFAERKYHAEIKDVLNFSLTAKILYSLFFFISAVFLCAHFTDIINKWILPDVSGIAIAFGLCAVVFLTLHKKRSSVFYSCVIVGFLCIIAVLIIRSMIVFGGETQKLFPIFEKERINSGFGYAFLACFGIFSFSSLIAYVYFQKGNALSWGIALGLSGIIFFLIIGSCIVLIGAEQTAASSDAMALAMRRSDLLGRGDILYFIWWIFFIITTFTSVGYAPKAILGRENDYPWYIYLSYSALLFFLALAVRKTDLLVDCIIWILSVGGGGILYITAIIASILLKVYRKEIEDEA